MVIVMIMMVYWNSIGTFVDITPFSDCEDIDHRLLLVKKRIVL